MLVHTSLDRKKSKVDPWLLNHTPLLFSVGSGMGYPIKQLLNEHMNQIHNFRGESGLRKARSDRPSSIHPGLMLVIMGILLNTNPN